MFKRKRAITAALLLMGLVAHLVSAEETRGLPTKGCVWDLRSKESVVTIVGSIHLWKKGSLPISAEMEEAFQLSDSLVLEVDPGRAGWETMQGMLLSKGIYQAGKTLEGSLSRGAFQAVLARAKETGLDASILNRLKPWLVALTVTGLKLNKLGLDPNYGVDRYFVDKAKKSGKGISGLETVEEQLALFDGMSRDTQESLLLQALKDLETIEKELDQLLQAWSLCDQKVLETLLLGSFKEYPDVYTRAISDRNRRWLPKIESLLDRKGKTMLIVGAGHLVGKDSIILLLKERGFLVEP
jgi:uncharacterized protein YbaP (TraB family)